MRKRLPLQRRQAKNVFSILHSAFVDLGNGTFRLKPGWTLGFTHAVLTTGDHPTTIASPVQSGQPVCGRSAGDVWSRCTGSSVTTQTCCVYNCSNVRCTPANPQPARATAHVYATFQLSDHNIRYMILLPTCSACNNCKQCLSCLTNYPLKGQQANILYTITEAQVMFVEVDDNTVSGKGAAGKGTGKGGHVQVPQGNPSDAPPGAHIAGQN